MDKNLICEGCEKPFSHTILTGSTGKDPDFCNTCEGLINFISIKYFRGFFEEQKIYLAKYNGEVGSGITYLVGENNSGKTTFLKVLLQAFMFGKFNEDERHRPKIMRIIAEGIDDGFLKRQSWEYGKNMAREEGEIARIKTPAIKDNRYRRDLLRDSYDRNFWQTVIFIGSNRTWNSEFKLSKNFVKGNDKYDSPSYIHELIGKYGAIVEWNRIYNHEFEKMVYAIQAGSWYCNTYKEELNELIRKIIPDFNDWKIKKSQKGTFVMEYIPKEGRPYRFDYLGEGILSIFKIMAGFLMAGGLFCIDEPELNLHPKYQKRLAKFLGEESSRRQIIISTHSVGARGL